MGPKGVEEGFTVFFTSKYRRVVSLLLAALFVLSLASCGIPDPIPKEKEGDKEEYVPAPDLGERPFGLAVKFLDLIRKEKFEEAYDYLSVDGKLRIRKDDFIINLKNCMQTGSTRRSYDEMKVGSERYSSRLATVLVINSRYSQAKPWIWEFEKTRGGWKIRSLDLPPVLRYEKKSY